MIFLVVILCGFSSVLNDTNNFVDYFTVLSEVKNGKDKSNNEASLSEEYESFFDDDEIEHIVNEELYCAECDDFYDEF